MKCISCGYDLRGLSKIGECFECGATIEGTLLQPLLSQAARQTSGRTVADGVRRLLMAGGALLVVVAVMMMVWWLVR